MAITSFTLTGRPDVAAYFVQFEATLI